MIKPSPPWGRGKGEGVGEADVIRAKFVRHRHRIGLAGFFAPLTPTLSPKGEREPF